MMPFHIIFTSCLREKQLLHKSKNAGSESLLTGLNHEYDTGLSVSVSEILGYRAEMKQPLFCMCFLCCVISSILTQSRFFRFGVY